MGAGGSTQLTVSVREEDSLRPASDRLVGRFADVG